MNGEDKIFLLTAVMTIKSGARQTAEFLLDKDNAHRLLAIREALGKDGFDKELYKLKEVIEP